MSGCNCSNPHRDCKQCAQKTAGWRPSKDLLKDPTQSLWIEEMAVPKLKRAWMKFRKAVIALLLEQGEGQKLNIIGSSPSLDVAKIRAGMSPLMQKFLLDAGLVTGPMLEQAAIMGGLYAVEQMMRTGVIPDDPDTVAFYVGEPSTKLLDTLGEMDLAALEGVTDEMSKQMVYEIGEGMRAGEGTYAITERIEGILDDGWRRAETIVRSEVMQTINDTTRDRFNERNIALCELITAQDDRTCEGCLDLHGEIAEVDGPGFEHAEGQGWPPFHPNCRCSIAPVIPGLYDGPYTEEVETWFDEEPKGEEGEEGQ